jgi:hypothetical protein
MFQMSIEYINIFQSKALKIYPNWIFGLTSGNPGQHSDVGNE